MNVLFLCSRLAGYMHHCVQTFVDGVPDAHATIVAVPSAANAPFVFDPHPRITIRSRNEVSRDDFKKLVAANPRFVFVAGWRDPEYRWVGSQLKNRVPVVMGMDSQWKGLWRQHLMAHVGRHVLRTFCNRAWIPGLFQYEYARRLGFRRNEIITGLYSASSAIYEGRQSDPGSRSPKKLVFVGNMWEEKGVNELVAAFRQLEAVFPDWNLQLLGGGPLVDVYRGQSPRIEVLGFRQPGELPEILRQASAFCLPSYRDQWAVVIHEACCAGLPIIATNVCGAVSAFVHDEYNGFRCAPRSVDSLKTAMQRLMSLPSETLQEFGRRSHLLSLQITPKLWASRIMHLVREANACV